MGGWSGVPVGLAEVTVDSGGVEVAESSVQRALKSLWKRDKIRHECRCRKATCSNVTKMRVRGWQAVDWWLFLSVTPTRADINRGKCLEGFQVLVRWWLKPQTGPGFSF